MAAGGLLAAAAVSGPSVGRPAVCPRAQYPEATADERAGGRAAVYVAA